MAVATLTLGGGGAWAQTVQDGTITGTVILPTGDLLGGATATVTSDALVAGERSTISNARGSFVFLGLPPGSYDLTVGYQGFRTYSQKNITLATGATVHVDVTLEIGAVEDTLVVTAEAPLIDTRSATIDTTFNLKLLEVVPNSRDVLYDLPLAAAGMASIGPHDGWLRGPSAHGGAISENVYLINGIDTTDPVGSFLGSRIIVNYDSIQELKVLSLGAKAEYPSFSGAVIEVLTKSGSNAYHGDLAYYTMVGETADNQGSSFGADWLWAVEGDDLMNVPAKTREGNFSLGGPIKRDLMWFYWGAAASRSLPHTTAEKFRPEYRDQLYHVKLTAEPGSSHRVWVYSQYHDYTVRDYGWWDHNLEPESLYTQSGAETNWSAQYQWVASDRSILSFKFLGFISNDDAMPKPSTGKPGYINIGNWGGNFEGGGERASVDLQESERRTVQADFSYFTDGFLGSHDLRFGVQYTRAEGNYVGGYFRGYGNFAYADEWSPRPSEWWNGPDELIIRNIRSHSNPFLTVRNADSTAGFVDDTWVLGDRVTLNLGLRYDRMAAGYGGGAVYELPETPAGFNNPTILRTRESVPNIYDFKTWSPRLGVAWTMTGDGRTVLRAHLGRYYAPIGVESLGVAGPDGPERHDFLEWYAIPTDEVDVNGDDWVGTSEFADTLRSLAWRSPFWVDDWGSYQSGWVLPAAPGTRSPYTDHFTLSVQRQIGRDFSLEASYIYKNTDDLLVYWPFAPDGGEFQWERLPYTTWTGFETEIFSVVLEDFDGNGVIDWDDALCFFYERGYEVRNMESIVERDADRTYQGLQLVLTKRFSNRWQVLASLNRAWGDGVAPRNIAQDFYIDGPIVLGNWFGSSMNHFTNNMDGPLPMTPKLMIKVAGSYTIPVIETDLGFRIRYDSGRPIFAVDWLPWYGPWGGEIVEGAILGTHPEVIVANDPNHPDWMPSTTILDLSFAKSFRVGRYGDVRVILDVLNATNDGAASQVGVAGWDYGRVYSVVPPRIMRLGLRYSF
jgi:outer membrane receptor protein involved in Fe transport